jgi:hypothetical protein
MPYQTNTDILLDAVVKTASQGLSTKLWINSAGATSYGSLKTASQKQPTDFNITIGVEYNNGYVVAVGENGGSQYFSSAELISKLDDAIQSMVDAMSALYTVTVTTWSAEVLDYKIQASLVADSLGAPTYQIALIAQINLYVA